jgi:hypothetical protein
MEERSDRDGGRSRWALCEPLVARPHGGKFFGLCADCSRYPGRQRDEPIRVPIRLGARGTHEVLSCARMSVGCLKAANLRRSFRRTWERVTGGLVGLCAPQ